MYEKQYNLKEGWSYEKTGVFSGDGGQDIKDGTITGSDKWRTSIQLLI